jgi:uncharacterized membrane protein YdjX (TVP38/TMEM64 family)
VAFIRRHWPKLVLLAFWLALIGAYWGYAAHYHLRPLGVVRRLIDVMEHGVGGALLYLAVFALQPLVFFPSGLLSGAAGFVWGPVLGTVLAIIGHCLSAVVAYTLGRYVGRDLLDATPLGQAIEKYTESLRQNSFQSVLFVRLIFLPFEQVSMFCGFLSVPVLTFLAATVLGSVPGVVAVVLLGSSAQGDFRDGFLHLNPWAVAASVGTGLVSLGLWRFLTVRQARRRREHEVCEDGEA